MIKGKRGNVGQEDVLRWIIALAVIIAVGFALRNVVLKFGV